MSAIQATFVDLKFIRTRSSVQIILEAPIEQAGQITAVLGYPNPGAETWVGVARIDMNAKPEKPKGGRLAMRAGIICAEPAFWRFLEHDNGWTVEDADSAAQKLRHICCVESRANLDHDKVAAARFNDLYARYGAWLTVAA